MTDRIEDVCSANRTNIEGQTFYVQFGDLFIAGPELDFVAEKVEAARTLYAEDLAAEKARPTLMEQLTISASAGAIERIRNGASTEEDLGEILAAVGFAEPTEEELPEFDVTLVAFDPSTQSIVDLFAAAKAAGESDDENESFFGTLFGGISEMAENIKAQPGYTPSPLERLLSESRAAAARVTDERA